MSRKIPVRATDLRGASRLAIDATLGLTRLIETLHHNILRVPGIVGKPTQQPARGITGFVYKSIRGMTRAVGGGIDLALGQLAGLLERGEAGSSAAREAVLAVLNGVMGDHLAATDNPLAITMRWRREGAALPVTPAELRSAIPNASGKVLLAIHGLCMNDLQWRRKGHDHAAALAVDAGFTAVYLHYNSGLHISTNARELAGKIEMLLKAWPVPVDELIILGHSMGGLLARSACHHAEVAQHEWLQKLRKMIFLGTPHHGAPLERGGNWIDSVLDASPYTTAFSRLGKLRSAGITDLRHASLVDADWDHSDRFARTRKKPIFLPLPKKVACYAIAASLSKTPSESVQQLLGDGLVPVASALGQSPGARRNLVFPKSRQWIGYGMNHLGLLNRMEVCAHLKKWV